MNYILNDIKTGCVLTNYEVDAKKRKLNPKTTVSVKKDTDIIVGDTFIGNQNKYTVGEILERKSQNVSGRDLITFISAT